uniref:Uncharacterized protein n=1 Tax=Anopheles minimus TaxID=112268 RepID=A0A182VR11_9DIPT
MAGESPPRRLSQIFDPLMSLSELQAQIQQQQHQLAHLKYTSGGGSGGGSSGGCPTPPLAVHPHSGMGMPPMANSPSTQTFSSSSTLQHHHGGVGGVVSSGGGGHPNGGAGYYNTTASSSTSLSSVSNQSTKLSSSSSTGSYIGGTLGSGGSGSGGGGGGGGGVGLPVPPPHVLGRIMMGSRSTPNSPRLMSRRNGSGSKPPPVPQKPNAAYIANPSLVALDCDAPWPPLSSLGPDPLSMVEGHHHHGGGGGGGYLHHQPEINWQERCLELQLELHRSRNQAGRVRDMLREKVKKHI